MSLNTVNQLTPNMKQWDHVGNWTPNVSISEGDVPAGTFRPASWLPVSRYDNYYENWYVISVGKIVAFDNDGCVVPAGLATATTLTYTADDVTQGTIDIRTGVAVTAGATITLSTIDGSTASFMGRTGTAMAISRPVGIAFYNYLKWAGGDGFNPADYTNYNYNMQHQVAILCKRYIEVPLVPTSQATESINVSIDSTPGNFAAAFDATRAKGWFDHTAIVGNAEFADVATNVVAYVTLYAPVAKSTPITLWAWLSAAGANVNSTVFVKEVGGIDEIIAAGDFYIDYTRGIVFMYESGGNAIPTALAGAATLTYYHYAAAPASVSTYACAVGDLKAGQFVTFDTNSNFVAATCASNSTTNIQHYVERICGQVLETDVFPKDYLEYVQTQYTSLGTVNQMSGSATGGLPNNITYAGASNKVVRLRLKF